jgi:hypothetical protein
MRFLETLALLGLAAQAIALSIGGKNVVVERESDELQDIVCLDLSHSYCPIAK